jgi:hypothetical protein
MIDPSGPARLCCPAGRHWSPFAFATLALLLLASAPAPGQDRSVRWTEVTRVEVPGDVGALLHTIPGALDSREVARGIHVHSQWLRHDHGRVSVVVDLEAGAWTVLDHDEGTYTRTSMAETPLLVAEARAVGEEAVEEAIGEVEREVSGLADEVVADAAGQVADRRADAVEPIWEAVDGVTEDVFVEVRSWRTEDVRTIEGYPAERHLVRLDLGLDEEVEGVEESAGGTLAIVMEVWRTDEFPDPDALQAEWLRQLRADGDSGAEGLAGQIATAIERPARRLEPLARAVMDPRVAWGLRRAEDLADDLGGTHLVRSVNVAVVPAGLEADEEELLRWRPVDLGDRLRDAAAEEVRGGARSAVRSAVRGILGRGDDRRPPERSPPAAPSVVPLLRVVTEITDVQDRLTPDDSLRGPAPGYTAARRRP